MNIVYFFLIYKNARQVAHTMRQLQAPGVEFYVHIDASSKEDFSCLQEIDHLYMAEHPHHLNWSGGEVTYAVRDCLHDIAKRCHGEYIVLMSESDYPVKNNDYIQTYLSGKQKDFITATPLPHPNPLHTPKGSWLEGGRRRYECYLLRLATKSLATIEPRRFNFGNFRQFVKVLRDNPSKLPEALKIFWQYPPRKHPAYMPPCGGDEWFIMRRTTAQKIVDFCNQHPDFMEYSQNTLVAAEMFIPTLAHHLVPTEEREDKTLRYISWHANGASSPVDLKLDDKDVLARSIADPDTLFVRKIQDINVCRFIDKSLESQNRD